MGLKGMGLGIGWKDGWINGYRMDGLGWNWDG